MISIVEFIDRLSALTKKNKSSYGTGAEVTGYINQSQLELTQYLFSFAEYNKNVEDISTPITVPATVTSDVNGIIAFPTGYNHMLNMRYIKSSGVFKQCHRISVNQLGIIDKIPSRRANLTKDRTLYSVQENGIQVYPEQALNFKCIFAKYPADASIAYAYTNINGEPRQVVGAVTDLVWNKNVYNLLLYMVMDKMGMGSRDQIVDEYARMGIAKESVKTSN